VKTGSIDDDRLFRSDITDHTVKRLGPVPLSDADGAIEALRSALAVENIRGS